jgi:hypothetical protein
MLSISSYKRDYVDKCRARMNRQLSAYEAVKAVAAKHGDDVSLADFEHQFFGNMVLALDSLFGHRSRAAELKNGNPLNEVRILCGSFMKGDGHLIADSTIKYDPAKSVLGYKLGDEIRLTAGDFEKLSGFFLDEIERKYA